MNRVPLLARRTRQKYSPSSSPKSCVFHGPAASVSSRLTSHVAVCIQTFCPIFRSSHSTGGRSHQSGVGTKLALWGRSEEHTSELQSLAYLVCRLLLVK